MSGRVVANGAVLALAALIVVWRAWWLPPLQVSPALAVLLHAAPLLPALWLLLRRHPKAPFWGAVAALLLFCHGVAEAWSSPPERVPALLEAALCVVIVVAASWDGMRARFARRRAV